MKKNYNEKKGRRKKYWKNRVFEDFKSIARSTKMEESDVKAS